MKQNHWLWIGLVLIVVVGAIFLVRSSNNYSANTPTTGTDTTGTSNYPTGGSQTATGAKPVVTTAGFAGVSSTTASLVGNIIPEGAVTTYWFEYGPTMSYGMSSGNATIPAGSAGVGIASNLTGLKRGTQYYFRLGAKNAYGQTYGSVYSFITTAK